MATQKAFKATTNEYKEQPAFKADTQGYKEPTIYFNEIPGVNAPLIDSDISIESETTPEVTE